MLFLNSDSFTNKRILSNMERGIKPKKAGKYRKN
jgi:hypothetical protein